MSAGLYKRGKKENSETDFLNKFPVKEREKFLRYCHVKFLLHKCFLQVDGPFFFLFFYFSAIML